MYGKIFDSIYDSTVADDWRALITFQQFIVLCDADGTVDMTPQAISRRTNIPLDHITAGIEILEAPDPYSRTEGHNGIRIERLDSHRPWGWSIVNHQQYKMMQDADEVREKNRLRKANERARKKECHAENVTKCDSHASHAKSRHTDTDTDIKTCARFEDFWKEWPKKQRKAPALAKWQSKKLDAIADQIIADVMWRKENYKPWQDGIYMHPVTYLNQVCWEDEREDTPDLDPLAGYAE